LRGVNKPESVATSSSNLVEIDSHAAATLRYIRNSMEAATAFTVPGAAGIAMSVVGLLATVLSVIPGLAVHWLSIWLAAAVIGALIGGVLVIRPASSQRLALSGTPIRKFAICLTAPLFAGAVLTAVLGTHDALEVIPGTWLLLYGCALIAASVTTTRTIGVMGASFMVLGLFAFLLPMRLQILPLGAGFGGLHLLFGWWISRESHERQI
jgi:hypothetical protein